MRWTRGWALLLLASCEAAKPTPVCGGSAGLDCSFGRSTDIASHGYGFVSINRNTGTGTCTGEGAAACDTFDFGLVTPGSEVITESYCATVLFFHPEERTGSCLGLRAGACAGADLTMGTKIVLGGGQPVVNATAPVACSGVAWAEDLGTAKCWGVDCTGVDFATPKTLLSNSGGAYVAADLAAGHVQCFGNEAAGGKCGHVSFGSARPSALYVAAKAFLAYDPKTEAGFCWGSNAMGGNCSNVNFTGTISIVGNDRGFVALQKDAAACWGDFSCDGLDFTGVTSVIAGSNNFVAVVPLPNATFCFPDGCSVANLTGAEDVFVPAGEIFIAYKKDAVADGIKCFAPSPDASTKAALDACASADLTGMENVVVAGGGASRRLQAGGSSFSWIAYPPLDPVDDAALIAKRVCYKSATRLGGLDHVVVVYGAAFGANGVYRQQPAAWAGNATALFLKADESWALKWTGCAWKLERQTVVVSLECEDDPVAANKLFGNEFVSDERLASLELGVGKLASAQYDANICGAAASVGFCKDAVVAAVCAGTCKTNAKIDLCTVDDDAALERFAALHGDPAKNCAEAAGHCASSRVVKAICRATCGFDHQPHHLDGAEITLEEYSQTFDPLRARRLFSLAGRAGRASRADPRSLETTIPGPGIDHYLFMNSVDASSAASGECPDAVSPVLQRDVYGVGVDSLTTTEVCDLTALGEKSTLEAVYGCSDLSIGFETTSFAFCPWMNVDTAQVAAAAAILKVSTNCEGDNEDSNAVCAPREVCEALCGEIPACIGFDMELGNDRCFLNRDAGYCTEDVVYSTAGKAGRNGTKVSGTGYGYEPGMRYPDGHVGARRLEHSYLWASDAHAFARKRTFFGIDDIFKTVSHAFCRADNLNATALAPKSVCAKVCDGADAATAEKFGCDQLDLTQPVYGPQRDDGALCLPREDCEELCRASPECISFDMHRSLPRCYLNFACTEEVGDVDIPVSYDLVLKLKGEACSVTISGADDPHGVGGVYRRVSTTSFRHTARPADQITLDADCGWTLARSGGQYYTTFQTCSPTVDEFTMYITVTKPFGALYKQMCLPFPGIGATYFCGGPPACETLQVCLLDEARMTSELADFRALLADVDGPLCTAVDAGAVTFSISQYEPKTLVDEGRVEHIFDFLASGGHTPSGGTSRTGGHYQFQELARDVVAAPRVRLVTLGEAVRGVVTVVRPTDDLADLGKMFPPPDGYASWGFDLIRIERFDASGYAVGGEIILDLLLPDHLSFEKLTFFRATGEKTSPQGDVSVASYVDITTEGATVEAAPENPGWVRVKLMQAVAAGARCGVLELGVAVDENECLESGVCEEDAVCSNLKGAEGGYHACTCRAGFRLVDGQCRATEAYYPPQRVRIENDVHLPLGWRIHEVTLYEDNACTALIANATKGSFVWVPYVDRFCKDNTLVPPNDFRDKLCRTVCAGNAYKNKPECVASRGKADTDSNALCMPKADCLVACGQMEDCTGIDMHEYHERCYLNRDVAEAPPVSDGQPKHRRRDPNIPAPPPAPAPPTCADQIGAGTLGDDHDYEFIYKSMSAVAKASSSTRDHGPNDAIDASKNAEWWSDSLNDDPLAVFWEVELSGFLTVGSARIEQVPTHAAARYRVSLGPAAPRPVQGVHVLRPGESIENRSLFTTSAGVSVENDAAPCVSLSCGSPGSKMPGVALAELWGVRSSCACKQFCLDHIDEGCRSWAVNILSDTNFDKTAAYSSDHHVCYLYTAPYANGKADRHWISGGLDVVYLGFTPQTASGPFDLVVTGIGFPSAQYLSAKVIPAGATCAAPLAEAVSGIVCTGSDVCSGPLAASEGSAKWSVSIAPQATETNYEVCVCAGVCFHSNHWTRLPGVITVAGESPTFTTSEPPQAGEAFYLTVYTGGANFTLLWRGGITASLVAAGLACNDSAAVGLTASTIPVVSASLAISMSAADIAVLMADEDTAMAAFATGLAAELGVAVIVTAITFSRRLDDGRELQVLSSVTVEFYTESLNAFAAIEALSTGTATSLVSKCTTALAAAGMPVTISSLSVAAPEYSSLTVVPPTPAPPCDPTANYTVLNKGLPNETVLENNACLPGNDTHVIMEGKPIRLRSSGERRLSGTDGFPPMTFQAPALETGRYTVCTSLGAAVDKLTGAPTLKVAGAWSDSRKASGIWGGTQWLTAKAGEAYTLQVAGTSLENGTISLSRDKTCQPPYFYDWDPRAWVQGKVAVEAACEIGTTCSTLDFAMGSLDAGVYQICSCPKGSTGPAWNSTFMNITWRWLEVFGLTGEDALRLTTASILPRSAAQFSVHRVFGGLEKLGFLAADVIWAYVKAFKASGAPFEALATMVAGSKTQTSYAVISRVTMTVSAEDFALLYADTAAALQAFEAGLEDTLGADVVITSLSFEGARRLLTELTEEERQLKALPKIIMDFYTEDLDAYASLDSLSSGAGTEVLAGHMNKALKARFPDIEGIKDFVVAAPTAGTPVPTAAPTPSPTSSPTPSPTPNVTLEDVDMWGGDSYGYGYGYGYGYSSRRLSEARQLQGNGSNTTPCDENATNASCPEAVAETDAVAEFEPPTVFLKQSLTLEMSVADAMALVDGFEGPAKENVTAAFQAALANNLEGVTASDITIDAICLLAHAFGSPVRCPGASRRTSADSGRLLSAGKADVHVDFTVKTDEAKSGGLKQKMSGGYGKSLVSDLQSELAATAGLTIKVTKLTASSVEELLGSSSDEETFYSQLSAFFGITTADLVVAAALATGHTVTLRNMVDYGLSASPLFRIEYGRVCGRARRLSCPYVAGARRLQECGEVAVKGEIPEPEMCPSIEEPEWINGKTPQFATWAALLAHADEVKVTWPGGGCGTADQFVDLVGQLAVTGRADIGRHFIIEPGAPASLELTGKGLSQDKDRLMLIDCQGTCGLTAPSATVVYPDGAANGIFAAFQPVRDVDREYAELVESCPSFNHTEDPFLVAESFEEIPARFCSRGSKAGTAIHDIEKEAVARLVELYACSRCADDPKATKFCGGFLGLEENLVANAICLPRYECEHLCILAGDACHSVSMHESLPRCFLNPPACAAEVADDMLGIDADYALLVKRAEAKENAAVAVNPRDLEEIDWPESTRGNLVSPSDGASSSAILRFAPLGIPAAGTFKVCFCDSQLSTVGGLDRCKSKEDFSVEIGRLHLSGLGCLLSMAQLRRASCVEQYFGGLRCVPQG